MNQVGWIVHPDAQLQVLRLLLPHHWQLIHEASERIFANTHDYGFCPLSYLPEGCHMLSTPPSTHSYATTQQEDLLQEVELTQEAQALHEAQWPVVSSDHHQGC